MWSWSERLLVRPKCRLKFNCSSISLYWDGPYIHPKSKKVDTLTVLMHNIKAYLHSLQCTLGVGLRQNMILVLAIKCSLYGARYKVLAVS